MGVLAFGVPLYPHLLPAAAVTFLVGAASFCAMGIAVGNLVPNGTVAVPIVNVIVLPMMLVSGIFSPLTGAPAWLVDVANVLPLHHMVQAFGGAFDPHTSGWGFAWGDLAVLTVWGAAGAVVAIRRFRWEPAASGTRRAGPRRRSLAHA